MACADLDALISRALDQLTVLRICTGYKDTVPGVACCAACTELPEETVRAAKKLVVTARQIENMLETHGKKP
jgi:hypothetical protein